MNVRRFINFPVSSNSYLVSNEGFKECVIIDPGSKDVTELISFLDENELRLIGIILTHEHFDHVWGANVLRGRYNAQIACSKRCLQKISIPQNYFNLLYYNDSSSFQIDSVDITVKTKITGIGIGILCTIIYFLLFLTVFCLI